MFSQASVCIGHLNTEDYLSIVFKEIMRKIYSHFKDQSLENRLKMLTKMHSDRGLHVCIRRTLLSSRMMGLLPLAGLSRATSDRLRYTLRSPYTIVYMVSLFGQCLMFLMSFYWLLCRGISLTNITNSVFYTSNLISSLILVNIGRSWPQVMIKVEEIEAYLPPFSRDVAKICDMTVVCTLLAALVEHLLSVTYGLTVAYSCSADNVAETYFLYNMPWIFDYTPYALWKGVLSEIFNIQSTFVWSINDGLIMAISIYLTEHFITHYDLLKTAVRHETFTANIFREQYMKIVRLVKLINGQVGIYILTSFGSNLYWICTQLFFSLNKTQTGHFVSCLESNPKTYNTFHGVEHTVYFTYSFSFLVARTSLVLLLAARIHSNSLAPLNVLYEMPSDKYNVEVERFISQINNIKVALSGLDFFYVTRTMILTLIGTIVTYELVLLQFNK